MKKTLILTIISVVAFAFIGTSMAVPPGKTVVYKGATKGKFGRVVFNGKKHAKAGKKCKDCHLKIFKMKKGSAKITMKDITAGKFCGACHNGKTAFKAGDSKNCKKCHKKKRKVIKGC